ncbi:hypothetical protein PG993_012647 [Apiospora rasikravindrae]|uniref:Transmembrane protein n=1 Tax=Apiospora rasikravindrae TaxID=990691 RepID=A0ABR1S2X4_9PEZI
MTTTLSLCLELAMVLLVCTSLIEVGLISTTLAWLHTTASAGFHFYDGVSPDSPQYTLAGSPAHFLINQVYVALADAGGAAFLLVCVGGFLALWARRRHLRLYHRNSYHLRHASSLASRALLCCYYAWVGLQIPLLLFTAATMGYVYNVTAARQGQPIRLEAAMKASSNSSGGTAEPYPLDSWTPQSWFPAVLDLDLVESRGDVKGAVSIMRGWLWNLCPLLVIQLAVVVLAKLELVQWRRARQTRTTHEIKRLSRV